MVAFKKYFLPEPGRKLIRLACNSFQTFTQHSQQPGINKVMDNNVAIVLVIPFPCLGIIFHKASLNNARLTVEITFSRKRPRDARASKITARLRNLLTIALAGQSSWDEEQDSWDEFVLRWD